MIIFGGDAGFRLNDMWSFDGSAWTTIQAAGNVPTPRFGHSLVSYEHRVNGSSTSMLLMLGGNDGAFLGDLWQFSLATRRWSAVPVTGTLPSPRAFASMTAISPSQYVLYGGFNGHVHLSDAWLLDMKTHTWRDVTPGADSGDAPRARGGHVAIWAEATSGDGHKVKGEVGTMAVTPSLHVHGGVQDIVLQDQWALYVEHGSWMELFHSPVRSPSARAYHTATWAMDRTLLFGGHDGSMCLSDLWVYGNSEKLSSSAPTNAFLGWLAVPSVLLSCLLMVANAH